MRLTGRKRTPSLLSVAALEESFVVAWESFWVVMLKY